MPCHLSSFLIIECSCRAKMESAQLPTTRLYTSFLEDAPHRLAEGRRSDWYPLVSLSTSCIVPASSTMSNEHRSCHPPRQNLTYEKPPATILSEAAWNLHESQSSRSLCRQEHELRGCGAATPFLTTSIASTCTAEERESIGLSARRKTSFFDTDGGWRIRAVGGGWIVCGACSIKTSDRCSFWYYLSIMSLCCSRCIRLLSSQEALLWWCRCQQSYMTHVLACTALRSQAIRDSLAFCPYDSSCRRQESLCSLHCLSRQDVLCMNSVIGRVREACCGSW